MLIPSSWTIILNLAMCPRFGVHYKLVTASNLNARPKLKDIITVSQDLGSGYSPSKIAEFYKVRSRDAAHDHHQAQNISRELAADCKLWSEELVINVGLTQLRNWS
jgi:hypothetical protein